MNALVAAAWVMFQVPWTLSSVTVRKPFAEIVSAGARNCPPALLTSRSRRPWRSSTASTRASTASSSRMSAASASAVPPKPSIVAFVSSIGSGRRPQPTTVAPSRASSIAVSRPRPEPAPETRQTVPSSRPGAKIFEGWEITAPSLLPAGSCDRLPEGPGDAMRQVASRPDEQAQSRGEPAGGAAARRRGGGDCGQGRAAARRLDPGAAAVLREQGRSVRRRCGCSASACRSRGGG